MKRPYRFWTKTEWNTVLSLLSTHTLREISARVDRPLRALERKCSVHGVSYIQGWKTTARLARDTGFTDDQILWAATRTKAGKVWSGPEAKNKVRRYTEEDERRILAYLRQHSPRDRLRTEAWARKCRQNRLAALQQHPRRLRYAVGTVHDGRTVARLEVLNRRLFVWLRCPAQHLHRHNADVLDRGHRRTCPECPKEPHDSRRPDLSQDSQNRA